MTAKSSKNEFEGHTLPSAMQFSLLRRLFPVGGGWRESEEFKG